jgi:KUP system potassium uptake protein
LEKGRTIHRLTLAGLIVTLGIVYGDIGTSPLYVMQAIAGKRIITGELIYGALSCIVWTLTIQTTFKYIILTLQADNKGEGGIFSLYALVRRRAKWLVIPAMIGGCALLADGIITPSITVSSAIEGLRLYDPEINTVPIVLVILVLLFLFQRLGTKKVGSGFGPIMFVWFLMLAILGLRGINGHWGVFKALSPVYAIHLLAKYPGGFWLLGAVFLCTTGAEALYSDLGHVGRQNIRVSWIFVKISLLLNYFGQAAWLMQFRGQVLPANTNPFYASMPPWFIFYGIIIGTAAAIIASQALITGSFTLISEAMRLNLWPKVKVIHPSDVRGQMFVPSINTFLAIGCCAVVLHFQESINMEAAYGLSITFAMLMTTILFSTYYYVKTGSLWRTISIGSLFLIVELSFLIANLAKFAHGGYFTIGLGFILFGIMYTWFRARKIRNRYMEFVDMKNVIPNLKALREDAAISKFATHLVYLTSADYHSQIEEKILYSIFNRSPKRADIYWFIHVNVMDEPYTLEYSVTPLDPGDIFRIDLNLGFRVQPRINLYFRHVMEDMVAKNEVDVRSRYESLSKQNVLGDFRFIVVEKFLSYENELPFFEKIIMDYFFLIKKISLSEGREFGLEPSSTTVEKFPLVLRAARDVNLQRVYEEEDEKTEN